MALIPMVHWTNPGTPTPQQSERKTAFSTCLPRGRKQARRFPDFPDVQENLPAKDNIVIVTETRDDITGGIVGWDLATMEMWIINRLFWDPTQDMAGLRHHFIERTYREAAPAMTRYYDIIRDSWLRASDWGEWGVDESSCPDWSESPCLKIRRQGNIESAVYFEAVRE